MSQTVLRVAVPSPVRRLFDYLLPSDGAPSASLLPGMRVRVPFGRRSVVGVLMELATDTQVPKEKLRRADAVLDSVALWSAGELELMRWASRYYQHPLGEVVQAALPAPLRRGQLARLPSERHWRPTELGQTIAPGELGRAPRQAAILALLLAHPDGLDSATLAAAAAPVRAALGALVRKGWVEPFDVSTPPAPGDGSPVAGPALNPAQIAALALLSERLGGFGPCLLEGVTGSGKTEVYLRLIAKVVASGSQALLLVPEIGLTPQMVQRFRSRFSEPVVVLHSGLNERQRLAAWLQARNGTAAIVIGTRSAVFAPLARLGIVIVDEEHDLSFKQQEGFRYNGRDLAVLRARIAGVPVVLGSATPSLETLYNAEQGRYMRMVLPERAGSAAQPPIEVVDLRRQLLRGGMAEPLREEIAAHLGAGGQVLLFLNRRGYAPALMCHDCGWVAQCRRCDARMTLHRHRAALCCHHCGAERAVDRGCDDCAGTDLRPVGSGTERIEEALGECFPGFAVIRVDRDTTRRRGELEARLANVRAGAPCILVGTQMLAKGHHFPEVTLVGLLDADQGLYSSDFRAGERMAQLIIQVAGRAGRAARPGRVMLQTHHPDHPLLQKLLRDGYGAFAAAALEERRAADLPPFTSQVLLRAEAAAADAPQRFLEQAAAAARCLAGAHVVLWGPIAAPMERRAGRFRGQLLAQSVRRGELQQLLDRWIPGLAELPHARRVRWSVDVDPLEML